MRRVDLLRRLEPTEPCLVVVALSIIMFLAYIKFSFKIQ